MLSAQQIILMAAQLVGGLALFLYGMNVLSSYLTQFSVTMIIQSSDATIGILQALAISVSVNFRMAVVIVCGAQIGTCITAILSSVGSGKSAKRAALIHAPPVVFHLPFYIL
ncbi:MAG: hypothetical protein E7325_01555 [Clostridiales bacterium]|nr:hypothetical protein [Clostridiales bacterium]